MPKYGHLIGRKCNAFLLANSKFSIILIGVYLIVQFERIKLGTLSLNKYRTQCLTEYIHLQMNHYLEFTNPATISNPENGSSCQDQGIRAWRSQLQCTSLKSIQSVFFPQFHWLGVPGKCDYYVKCCEIESHDSTFKKLLRPGAGEVPGSLE